MTYYIARFENDNTIIGFAPFEDRPYITVEELPEGDGPLMCTKDGTLYRGSIPQEPVLPPDPMAEINLLKQQLKAASDQNDFLEDCIAEMAEIVYA